jgi:hypothetical protein
MEEATQMTGPSEITTSSVVGRLVPVIVRAVPERDYDVTSASEVTYS